MSYTIWYFINIPGSEFNRYLDPSYQMSPDYFKRLRVGESDHRDGMLPGDQIFLGVDLTGKWTEVHLPYSYSGVFIDDAQTKEHVARVRRLVTGWERRLRELFPTREIYRVERN